VRNTASRKGLFATAFGLGALVIPVLLHAPAACAQDYPVNFVTPAAENRAPAKPRHAALPAQAQPSTARDQQPKQVQASAKETTQATAPHTAHAPATATASTPTAKPAGKGGGQYYVDFRARTAASYGHAFVWYGRTNQKAVEVAGLHPATDSVIPYVLGHILPVPSETGASYGDLDEQYLTAHYRILMNEADAKRVFAYIKHLQETSPLWNAATFNCIAFISDIAQYMGLKVPSSNLLYPEDWVNQLKALNAGRKSINLPASQAASSTSRQVQ
jgi:cell wall-associated NlpC family hydrolase